MTKMLTLLTVLTLGVSSTAAAYPRDERPDYNHRRAPDMGRPGQPDRYRPNWVPLASPARLRRGGMINVNLRGTFTQLRIQNVSGQTFVQRVIVRFRNGERQIVEISRELAGSNAMVDVDLAGSNRKIARVTVLGWSQRGGRIQVYGI